MSVLRNMPPSQTEFHEFNYDEWEKALVDYPDREQKAWLLHSIKHGATLFVNPIHNPPSQVFNLPTSTLEKVAITNYVHAEVIAGHIAGPFDSPPLGAWVNPLGAVPKDTHKFRVITHLSSPKDKSVNDCINKDQVTVKYPNNHTNDKKTR